MAEGQNARLKALKLTIPVMPENPGEYTVEIYFNGMYVTTELFTIQ